jgi:hypothetical protein
MDPIDILHRGVRSDPVPPLAAYRGSWRDITVVGVDLFAFGDGLLRVNLLAARLEKERMP